ncbi:hypothetical protein CPB85DRAFT_1558231 [Mucidula mucida]|nr:hypothetical protein CPB85DRAFT_1558231 [Mucidula mucida]
MAAMVDTVVPIPTRELSDPVDELMIFTCLIVQGRLNVEPLSDALSKLIDHWPILGARLHRRGKRSLEYHIPPEFSKDRSRFTLTVEKHDTPIPEANLPRRVAVHRKDAPIINLHITCFTDVTCVGVGIPHAVADAPGICIILRAWTSVLAGDFLPPPLLQEDPLADFGDPLPKTRAEMEKHRQGNEELVPALEYLAKGSMLFLGPVDKQREKAVEVQKENGDKAIRLSENDILVAIVTKLYLFNRSRDSPRPLTISMNASVRGQIPELPKDEGSRYIHNAFLPLCAPALAIKDAKDMSPTDIALHIRHTVIEQRTPEDLAKVMPLYREMARRGEYPGYFDCTGSGHHVTSWVAGGFGFLDFSPAVRGEGSGKVLFAGGDTKIPGTKWGSSLCTFVPTDSFGEGGYWLGMGAYQGVWPKIEEYAAYIVCPTEDSIIGELQVQRDKNS